MLLKSSGNSRGECPEKEIRKQINPANVRRGYPKVIQKGLQSDAKVIESDSKVNPKSCHSRSKVDPKSMQSRPKVSLSGTKDDQKSTPKLLGESMKLNRSRVEVAPCDPKSRYGNRYHPQDSFGPVFNPYNPMAIPRRSIVMIWDHFPISGPMVSCCFLVFPIVS